LKHHPGLLRILTGAPPVAGRGDDEVPMASLRMDVRHGARMLFKTPGLCLAAILMLAVGIGGNTALFSVIDAVLLRPLPYKDADRLVRLLDVQNGLDDAPQSYPEFLDWREETLVFQSVGASFTAQVALTGDGEPENLHTERVSASLLPMLGVTPPLGRLFGSEDEGPQGARVALIGDGLWRRRFGADPAVLGRSLMLDGDPWTVIGVLPRGFDYFGSPEVVEPLRLDPEKAPRGLHFLPLIARLQDGVPLERARADVKAISERMQKDQVTDHGMRFVPLKDWMVADAGTTLYLLLGALGCLLLIACANIAGLLLSRAASRRKEVAVRLAIGAGRRDIVRQFLVESALLALSGGLFGTVFAWWGLDLLKTLPATGIPRLGEAHLDLRVLAFTALLSCACALLFGLAPAFQALATNLNETLNDAGRGSTGAQQRLRQVLVVGEVALSLVLLVGAGLLLESLLGVLRVDRGFDAHGVLTARIFLSRKGYQEGAAQTAFFDQVLQRVAVLPGVEAAAVTNSPPLGGNSTNGDILIEGRQQQKDENMITELRRVSPDYLRVLRIPLLRGRGFTAHDSPQAPAVALVNQAFVDRFLPGVDPIGRRIDAQWETHGWQEIVGVVGNVKHDTLETPTLAEIYLPVAQVPLRDLALVIRSAGDPVGLTAAVRAQVFAVDASQPVYDVRTMEGIVDASVGARRLTSSLLGAFSVLALSLAATGLYGVLAFWVTQRRREIGVRMALGARRTDVVRLVLKHALTLVGIGLATGFAGALGVTRVLAGLLFGVTARDPIVLAGVPLLVAAVALLACTLPARRAARVDPMVALRTD
jgi:putative ABC transport system permease protein